MKLWICFIVIPYVQKCYKDSGTIFGIRIPKYIGSKDALHARVITKEGHFSVYSFRYWKHNWIFCSKIFSQRNEEHSHDDETALYQKFTREELKSIFDVQDHFDVPGHTITRPKIVAESLTLTTMSMVINGELITVDLVPTLDQLLSENFLALESLKNDKLVKSAINTKPCHFKSISPNIQAAISNCDNYYRGVVIMNDGIYVLQPVPSRLQQPDHSPLHVVYKRNVPTEFCGLNETHFKFQRQRLSDDASIGVPTSRMSKMTEVTLELGVFVDYELWRKYQADYYSSGPDAHLQDFVLALLNNMQILYHHPTLTPKVNFKVVRYEVLKSQPSDFPGTSDAQTYLDNFCNYQYKVPGRNWDHSLLLTGYDIVRFGSDRSISGIARLHGVCDTYNACTVAEGLDFTATFIATHEIGHSLGMRHDEPYCTSDFIMSGSLGSGKVSWSTCSVNDFQKAMDKLDSYGKNCLRQTGSDAAQLAVDGNNLPGQKFTADQQCALMHGTGYHQVTPWTDTAEGMCYMMWCSQVKYGRIITSHPALEGTNCASGKYCIRGRCTIYSGAKEVRPQITDGQWSSWSPVFCSRCTCSSVANGVGVLKSTRTCTNPAPNNGGKDCTGEKTRGIVCNTACGSSGYTVESYATFVCTNHKAVKNDHELLGTGVQLTNYEPRACKVFCEVQTAAGQKSYRAYGDVFPDGTSCGSEKYCVDGECLTLQCGNTLLNLPQSTCLSSSDRCVQEGQEILTTSLAQTTTSTSTTTTSQTSTTTTTVLSTTQQPTTLSTLSTVTLSTTLPTTTTTANNAPVTAGSTPTWQSWSVWSSCSVTCGQGSFTRNRLCSGSSCTGSAEETFTCNVATCTTSPSPTSFWTVWSEWSSCSATCGRGQRKKSRSCTHHLCKANWEEQIEPCGFHYCPWSEWSHCSVSCGQGQRAKYRYCPGGYCKDDDNLGSNQTESCVSQACVNVTSKNSWLEWSTWSDCSVTCGKGTHSRMRLCSGTDCAGPKEENAECQGPVCSFADGGIWYEWSDWSSCTHSCDTGTQSRSRQCSKSNCDGAGFETTSCNSQLCGNDVLADDVGTGQYSHWAEWSECSVSCGKGQQFRHRSCRRGSCKGRQMDDRVCYVALCAQWGGWSWWSNCDTFRISQKRIRNCYGKGVCLGSNFENKPC